MRELIVLFFVISNEKHESEMGSSHVVGFPGSTLILPFPSNPQLLWLSLYISNSSNIHFPRIHSNSISNNQNSDPIQWHPKPKHETVHSTTDPSPIDTSNPLPFTVISFDPRIPRHPMPLSSRLDHRCHHHYQPWKPRKHGQDFDHVARGGARHVARGGARHVARGWTRFGLVERGHRGIGMGMERSELLRRLYDPEQEIKDAHTGLVKRIRKFLNQF
ncbi:unnamed protein product [Sphenostylis stenocarpa]|uniref:Uncharacterized protein n=1 Tax=Sphenostylis stenocarpa TaxID=92480 RepID=A0AA86VCF4_9FABA|nr:unnamed protein product [Sphenostylis stenocarpa]